jgi:acyl-phosphate glycerol 3-phosphate acyltransferase
MTAIPTLLLCALGSYFIGAIPFGYLVGRMRGINIFEHGSGNLGATNVGRILGKRFGILVFLFDFLKGALPVFAVLHFVYVDDYPAELFAIVAGMAAFLGHLFPIYLGFRGGKGVSTGAGVVAVLMPGPAMGAVITFVVVLFLTRFMSVASTIAALMLFLIQATITVRPFAGANGALTCFCAIAAILVVVRHSSNVRRLFAGTEGQLLKENATTERLARIMHVLMLGFWFGGAAFFSFVATPLIFTTFDRLVENRSGGRPEWLPTDLTKLQASQLAGLAVSPIFPEYFLLQGICGLLALAMTFRLTAGQPLNRFERWRVGVLATGVAAVLLGLPLVQKIDALRTARAHGDEAARAAFAAWHLASLLLNFITVGFAAAALGMAAFLPAWPTPCARRNVVAEGRSADRPPLQVMDADS